MSEQSVYVHKCEPCAAAIGAVRPVAILQEHFLQVQCDTSGHFPDIKLSL